MRKRKIFILVVSLAIVSSANIFMSGCSEKIVNTEPHQIGITMQAKLSTPAMLQAVEQFMVIVSARDIEGLISEPLAYVNGILEGKVIVPAGQDRIFVLLAMDAQGNTLYSGETVTDVSPDNQEMLIAIDLYPVAPLLYLKPHYQEYLMGDVFTVGVYIDMVPGISAISLAFNLNSFPGGVDSMGLGSTLSPASTTFEAYPGNFLYYADISYFGDVQGSLTDFTGYAHLATMYFYSYADWGFDTATVAIAPEIMGLWDIGGASLPPGGVYTDNAEIFLTRPPLSK